MRPSRPSPVIGSWTWDVAGALMWLRTQRRTARPPPADQVSRGRTSTTSALIADQSSGRAAKSRFVFLYHAIPDKGCFHLPFIPFKALLCVSSPPATVSFRCLSCAFITSSAESPWSGKSHGPPNCLHVIVFISLPSFHRIRASLATNINDGTELRSVPNAVDQRQAVRSTARLAIWLRWSSGEVSAVGRYTLGSGPRRVGRATSQNGDSRRKATTTVSAGQRGLRLLRRLRVRRGRALRRCVSSA